MSSLAYHEYTAIILGGTGRLGSHLVRSFLLSPLCSRLVSVGRPGHADRLNNFITDKMGAAGAKSKLKAIDIAEDLSDLPAAMKEHGTGAELAVSALGARGGRYGLASPADLLRLDVAENLSFAETAAQDLGASHITLMSHVGANYARWTKNENAEDEATPRNFKDAKGLLETLSDGSGNQTDPTEGTIAACTGRTLTSLAALFQHPSEGSRRHGQWALASGYQVETSEILKNLGTRVSIFKPSLITGEPCDQCDGPPTSSTSSVKERLIDTLYPIQAQFMRAQYREISADHLALAIRINHEMCVPSEGVLMEPLGYEECMRLIGKDEDI
ncbi:hypothetical protein FOL46_004234 [Perkinsus olseni]|nr:hypothetical protein FOL46_004234 [Perkinsus olseni]